MVLWIAYKTAVVPKPMSRDDWAQWVAPVNSSKLCTSESNFASVDPSARADAFKVGGGGMVVVVR